MRGTWAWLRLDLPRRWRSLLVLALLIAVATGTVLTSVAGARRGATAAERLWGRTLPATAAVLPNDPSFDWEKIRGLPEVEALGSFAVAPFFVDEFPKIFGYLPPADDALMRTIERPVVLDGRLPDPARPDEVVVTAQFPRTYGKHIGDTLTLHLMTPEQAEDPGFYASEVPRPGGPRVTARIVGVVRSTWFRDDVVSASGGHQGSIYPSPALFTHHPANFVGATKTYGFVNALVRLRGGEAALPAFRQNLEQVSGRADIDVWNNADLLRHEKKVDSFESTCLLAFGLAALAAAIVLIGQALVRYAGASVAELRVLRSLGMDRRQTIAAAAGGPTIAGLTGGILGAAGALMASAWMPIGSAAAVEPVPGIDADPLVLIGGPLAVLVLVTGAAALAARLAFAAGEPDSRRSAVAVAVSRGGLPLPVVIGTRLALEPGRGRSAVPVRPALTGAVFGILGVVAALTFSAGVTDAGANPSRFGQTYQLGAVFGEGGTDWTPAAPAVKKIADDPDVVAVNDTRVAVAEAGNISVTLYSHHETGGRFPVVLRTGRMPVRANQVVLAPTTARQLGAGIGSRVRLTGSRAPDQVFSVTGIGFVPEASHNSYDVGGWVTAVGYDRLFDGFKNHAALIALRPGARPEAVLKRLTQELGGVESQNYLVEAPPPSRLAEIRKVQGFPRALGAFLALLAVAAVGHGLATAVRRRRHDVAVLRALGMTRRQSRVIVYSQASVLALVGLGFGVPLGLALGRTAWRVVADYTPLQYVPPVAVLATLLMAPAVLLVANALAAWPGRQAARIRIGHVLRAE